MRFLFVTLCIGAHCLASKVEPTGVYSGEADNSSEESSMRSTESQRNPAEYPEEESTSDVKTKSRSVAKDPEANEVHSVQDEVEGDKRHSVHPPHSRPSHAHMSNHHHHEGQHGHKSHIDNHGHKSHIHHHGHKSHMDHHGHEGHHGHKGHKNHKGHSSEDDSSSEIIEEVSEKSAEPVVISESSSPSHKSGNRHAEVKEFTHKDIAVDSDDTFSSEDGSEDVLEKEIPPQESAAVNPDKERKQGESESFSSEEDSSEPDDADDVDETSEVKTPAKDNDVDLAPSGPKLAHKHHHSVDRESSPIDIDEEARRYVGDDNQEDKEERDSDEPVVSPVDKRSDEFASEDEERVAPQHVAPSEHNQVKDDSKLSHSKGSEEHHVHRNSHEHKSHHHHHSEKNQVEIPAESALIVSNEPRMKAQFETASSTVSELSRLLSQLYGRAVTDFAKDAESYEQEILEIDCNHKSDDFDWKVNIVTTLCPFLRDDDESCGTVRHSSYTVTDRKKLCSPECAKNIDAIMSALPMRKRLTRKTGRHFEASIFRAIVNSILLQYASACRVGTWFMPN